MKKEKTITVKVSEKDYEKIKTEADKEGITVSDYIRSRIKGNITVD